MSDRIKNLKRPDFSEPHEVLVLVQNPKELSYVLELPKVKLIELKSQGVAKSRNAAIKHASGEFLIFGDDDIVFKEKGISEAIRYFQSHPQCSIILARIYALIILVLFACLSGFYVYMRPSFLIS